MQQSAVVNVPGGMHEDLAAHIRSLAAERPMRRAVTHLIRGEEEGLSVTYAGLDHLARSVGALLQAKQARGERAILLFDAGIEPISAFLGCLYSSVIAVPLPAPLGGRIERHLSRIEKVVQDADVKFVLTTSQIMSHTQEVASKIPGLKGLAWIATDTLPDLAHQWKEEAVDESDVAYLQYTSGSTSDPKGVMISRKNLFRICEYDSALLEFPSKGAGTVCWMPYFHDAGLIEGLLVPLYNGLPVYVMSPMDFVAHPFRWLKAIDRYRASHSAGPNCAFEMCVKKTTPEQRKTLDLSSWRRASISAEPINSGTIQRFLEAFAPCGFDAGAMSPAWGLAEATLAVTATPGFTFHMLNAADLEQNRIVYNTGEGCARTMVGCGRITPGSCGVDLQIVDPETCKPAPAGTVGEAWVSGETIALGYWHRPQETADIFHGQMVGGDGKRYLRTGDLGFMAGDEFVFTGRLKDLIIVEGRNHYPQDIEKTVEESHSALRRGCSIAFSLEEDGQAKVVVVAEVSRDWRVDDAPAQANDLRLPVSRKEIDKAIRKEVSEEHQIRVHQVVLISAGTIPKTTSGKLQRARCRQEFLARASLAKQEKPVFPSLADLPGLPVADQFPNGIALPARQRVATVS